MEEAVHARWELPRAGDLVLVRDFAKDKHLGKKIDPRWLGPRLLTEISETGTSGHVRELYGDETKRQAKAKNRNQRTYQKKRERKEARRRKYHFHIPGMSASPVDPITLWFEHEYQKIYKNDL